MAGITEDKQPDSPELAYARSFAAIVVGVAQESGRLTADEAGAKVAAIQAATSVTAVTCQLDFYLSRRMRQRSKALSERQPPGTVKPPGGKPDVSVKPDVRLWGRVTGGLAAVIVLGVSGAIFRNMGETLSEHRTSCLPEAAPEIATIGALAELTSDQAPLDPSGPWAQEVTLVVDALQPIDSVVARMDFVSDQEQRLTTAREALQSEADDQPATAWPDQMTATAARLDRLAVTALQRCETTADGVGGPGTTQLRQAVELATRKITAALAGASSGGPGASAGINPSGLLLWLGTASGTAGSPPVAAPAAFRRTGAGRHR